MVPSQTTPAILHSLQPPPLQYGQVARTLGEVRVLNGTRLASLSNNRLLFATPSFEAAISLAF